MLDGDWEYDNTHKRYSYHGETVHYSESNQTFRLFEFGDN